MDLQHGRHHSPLAAATTHLVILLYPKLPLKKCLFLVVLQAVKLRLGHLHRLAYEVEPLLLPILSASDVKVIDPPAVPSYVRAQVKRSEDDLEQEEVTDLGFLVAPLYVYLTFYNVLYDALLLVTDFFFGLLVFPFLFGFFEQSLLLGNLCCLDAVFGYCG